MITLVLATAFTWADGPLSCKDAAKLAMMCCQGPLEHVGECLKPEAKVINDRLVAHQRTVERAGNAIRDTVRERQAQAQVYTDSAALNTHLAERCEKLVSECFDACRPLQTSEAKSAAARCTEDRKAAGVFTAQAARDANLARRERRATAH